MASHTSQLILVPYVFMLREFYHFLFFRFSLNLPGENGLKDKPTRHQTDILFMQTQPTRRPAKVVSESLAAMRIASTTRLRPSKGNLVWTSPAMRNGCKKLPVESLSIVNQCISTRKIYGKL